MREMTVNEQIDEEVKHFRDELKAKQARIDRLERALEEIIELKQHVYNGERVWSTTPLSKGYATLIAEEALEGE